MAERPVGRVNALHVKDGHFHGEALERRPLSKEEALAASKSCAYASHQFRKYMRLSGRWLAQLRKHNEDYGEGQPFWITVQKGNRNFCDFIPCDHAPRAPSGLAYIQYSSRAQTPHSSPPFDH